MKKSKIKPVVIAFMLALVSLSISAKQPDKHDKHDKDFAYKIGDTGPGGGYIFFVDYFDQYPGFTYLEAAPEDAADSIVWCNPSTLIIGLDGWDANAVGRGRYNTDAMVAVCTRGAAIAADTYTAPNGTADWFLPSLGEAMLMYTNLRQAGVGGFASVIFSSYYWSSTTPNDNQAWAQYFHSGDQHIATKKSKFRVRAVRAF